MRDIFPCRPPSPAVWTRREPAVISHSASTSRIEKKARPLSASNSARPDTPYTVGVLLLYMIFGLIAAALSNAVDCPWHAFNYRNAFTGDDTTVSREEWNLFIGNGVNTSSFCGASPGAPLVARTCGDGTANATGCRYTFDALGALYKLSDMLPDQHGGDHGDEALSADELWTPRCNLLRDLVGLSDMDPHLMLVIFLPTLLFESATFGVRPSGTVSGSFGEAGAWRRALFRRWTWASSRNSGSRSR